MRTCAASSTVPPCASLSRVATTSSKSSTQSCGRYAKGARHSTRLCYPADLAERVHVCVWQEEAALSLPDKDMGQVQSLMLTKSKTARYNACTPVSSTLPKRLSPPLTPWIVAACVQKFIHRHCGCTHWLAAQLPPQQCRWPLVTIPALGQESDSTQSSHPRRPHCHHPPRARHGAALACSSARCQCHGTGRRYCRLWKVTVDLTHTTNEQKH